MAVFLIEQLRLPGSDAMDRGDRRARDLATVTHRSRSLGAPRRL